MVNKSCGKAIRVGLAALHEVIEVCLASELQTQYRVIIFYPRQQTLAFKSPVKAREQQAWSFPSLPFPSLPSIGAVIHSVPSPAVWHISLITTVGRGRPDKRRSREKMGERRHNCPFFCFNWRFKGHCLGKKWGSQYHMERFQIAVVLFTVLSISFKLIVSAVFLSNVNTAVLKIHLPGRGFHNLSSYLISLLTLFYYFL